MALIDSHPRSATVKTTTDAVLFQINLEAFNDLRTAFQPAAFKVLRAVAPLMCERLRTINERVGEFFKNPEQDLSAIEEKFLGSAGRTAGPDNGGGA
jgi:CRP-like cAMP-binding protein